MQWNPSDEGPSRDPQLFQQYDSGLDKENTLDSKHESDLSLYDSCPKTAGCIDDHDTNTQDSGYEGGKFYQFAQSLGVTPHSLWSGKRSFGSLDSFEEEFMNLDEVNENALPTDFNTLISGKLDDSFQFTPNKTQNSRPAKRARSEMKSPSLEMPCSVNEESIKCAIQRSSTEPDLIGDFTKSYCLPLISGRHQDLKSIDSTTLANLIKGNSSISYKIIDCRFPYEFEGGHINGAVNLYTKDQILDLLNVEMPENSHCILIFHCEFSSERGPSLSRFLRNIDRIQNKGFYPKLKYPELYVLEGGYKNFYEQFKDLCLPEGYKPMLHPEHQHELRYFKNKSKVCSEGRLHPNNRGKFKRLGFL